MKEPKNVYIGGFHLMTVFSRQLYNLTGCIDCFSSLTAEEEDIDVGGC